MIILRGIWLNLDILRTPVDADERTVAIDELVLELGMLQRAISEHVEELRG